MRNKICSYVFSTDFVFSMYEQNSLYAYEWMRLRWVGGILQGPSYTCTKLNTHALLSLARAQKRYSLIWLVLKSDVQHCQLYLRLILPILMPPLPSPTTTTTWTIPHTKSKLCLHTTTLVVARETSPGAISMYYYCCLNSIDPPTDRQRWPRLRRTIR